MVIFHCYVSSPEGNDQKQLIPKQHQTQQSVQVLAPLGRLLAHGAEAFYALDAGTAKCRFDPGKMGEILDLPWSTC